MDKNEAISALKTYFQRKADVFNIEMAFLYGSWASGLPKKEPDVDIAGLSTVPEFRYAKGRIMETLAYISREMGEFESDYISKTWQDYSSDTKLQKRNEVKVISFIRGN